jgi:DNA-binding CsgD family transcriptional regulator/N-acetylneuraminic acid mutarotase
MNDQPATNGLSERELEVLHLVATGASNKEIARVLSISQNTVKVHVRNIFSKTGATSRTEAAMYAVRLGLVSTPSPVEVSPGLETGASSTAGQDDSTAPADTRSPSVLRSPWLRVSLFLLVLLLVVWGGNEILNNPAPVTAIPSPAPLTSQSRWESEAALPAGRSGLALAVYENQIYAIGGQMAEGVVGTLTRYRPGDAAWETLEEKPTPVMDVGAAVVGGRLFVPGGRKNDQMVTDILEIFEPREGTWLEGAAMPVALSAYSIVAFEGRVYLFGGWDGERYSDYVYIYDPTRDAWEEGAPMPTARGFSGAAVNGGRIYVIGGRDETGPLNVNEEYAPDLDGSGELAWRTVAAMPDRRFGIGVAGLAGVVHVFGGEGDTGGQAPWKYFPASDTWQPFEKLDDTPWAFMGMVAAETDIHVIGGLKGDSPSADHQAYQAVFTIAIPVIPQP